MNDISLDVPTVTRYALGDMPDSEIRLLKLTHAAPGAALALQEEAAEIQQISQWVADAFASQPLPDGLALTPAQRDRVLKMAETPHITATPAAEPRKPRQTTATVERAIALRAGLWTLGAAAAVVGLLFAIQTPADNAPDATAATSTGPTETTTGKFKVHKLKPGEKPFDSGDLARRGPNPPALPPQTTPKVELAPPNITPPNQPIIVEGTKPQKIGPPAVPRGPAPVDQNPNGAENNSYAAPKP